MEIRTNIIFIIILIEDPKIGGFTAYFEEFPNIMAEGKTSKEAEINLTNALHDILKAK